jgi:hypothetical protein
MTDGFQPFAGGWWIAKDPDAELDYMRDWSDWLTAVDDTIASVEWIVSDGLEQVVEKNTHTATTATVWLAGGTAGASYPVTCRITTVAGRIEDRSFDVRCQSR